ncbi:hypothetical protein LCGC14_1792990 [marine sediment metagenome]|uniref:Uncharacterized protein n=1 Tax=marine sediment metagenome TaxID=412755 RepID=A0A0F9GS01_9ZZZZ
MYTFEEYKQKFLPVLIAATIVTALLLLFLFAKDKPVFVGNVYGEEVSWYCYYNECSPKDLQLECREKIVDLVEYIEANKPDDIDFCVVGIEAKKRNLIWNFRHIECKE